MTSFDYSTTAATSTRLLARYGAPATLKRLSNSAYDPTTGTTTPTYTSINTTCVVVGMPQILVDGTLIKQGDMQALIIPSTQPQVNDILSWQGKDWTVISYTPISPAGVPVLWKAQIRG